LQISFFWPRSRRAAILGASWLRSNLLRTAFGSLSQSQTGHLPELTREFGFVS